MRYDGNLRLGQIYDSESSLLTDIITIQEHHTASRVVEWGQKLRFLRIPDETVKECPWCHTCCEDTPLLRLTEPHEHQSRTDYVCVSYCWNSSVRSCTAMETPCHIITLEGCRQSRARSSVLRRAVNYAVAHRIPFVWIDQECIEQDNSEEKELGIHSMDIVYRSSAHPLAIIDTVVNCQEEMDLIAALLDCEIHDRMRLLFHIRDVLMSGDIAANMKFLGRLLQDPTWSRAWIFQEQGLVHDKMVLLLPHALGIRKHTIHGSLNDEIEIPLSHILFWPLGFLATTQQQVGTPIPGAEGISTLLTDRILVAHYLSDLSSFYDKMTRHTAANCWSQIGKKHIAVTSDRLAILANLTHYQRRLDTMSLEKSQYGTSVAVLALTILNGDITPFIEYEPALHLSGSDCGATEGTFWFSSSKLLLSMTIEEALFHWTFSERLMRLPLARHPRLPNVHIAPTGLQMSGWLWVVDNHIDLHDFSKRNQPLLSSIVSEYSPQGPMKVRALLYLFFLDLLVEMKKRRLFKIEDSIRITLGYHSRGRFSPPDLTWALMDSTGDPIEPPNASNTGKPGTPQDLGAYSFSLLDQPLDQIRWIISWAQNILTIGGIWSSRLHGFNTPMALFGHGPGMVFTTTDVDIDNLKNASAPIGLLNVVSVEVNKINRPGSLHTCQQLVYTGRWQQGIWYAPKELARNYEFPWT